MVVKVISVCLMLSCFFLRTSAVCDMKLTEEQYDAFAGYDPGTFCGSEQTMAAECNKIGVAIGATDGQVCFYKGFPHCSSGRVSLKNSKGDQVFKSVMNVLFCYWTNEKFYAFGKGKDAHHVMSYAQDCDLNYYPCKDLKV